MKTATTASGVRLCGLTMFMSCSISSTVTAIPMVHPRLCPPVRLIIPTGTCRKNKEKADFVLIHLNGKSVDEGKQIIADVHGM